MKVRMIQLLCPSRHCIVAAAYESNSGEPDLATLSDFKGQVQKLGLNPWCGICGSRDLKYEDMATKFATMEEAKPHIECEECKNVLSRMSLDELKMTFDSRRQNAEGN